MKKIFQLSLFLSGAAVILYMGLFAFVNLRGSKILADKIEAELGARPEIEKASLKFPFTFQINNFSLGDLSFIRAKGSLLWFNPFNTSFYFSNIYLDELNVTLKRENNDFSLEPFLSQEQSSSQVFFTVEKAEPGNPDSSLPDNRQNKRQKDFSFQAKKIELNKAQITYLGQNDDKINKLILSDIHTEIKDLSYPRLTKFFLDFSSSLEVEEKVLEKAIVASGWVDYFAKNMNVDLKILSFPYTFFSDYYPPFWQADNLGIKKAFLSSEVKLEAEANDLLIDTALFLDEIEFLIIEEDGPGLSRQRMVKTVLSLLRDKEGRSKVRFRLKTKMDSPQITPASLGESFKKSLPLDSKAISSPFIERTADAIRVPKEALDLTVDAFKGTLDVLKDIFGGQN